MTINTKPMTYEIGQFVGYVPIEKPVDLTPDPDQNYVVLQTEPGREMTAQANLIMRKVPFYLPTVLRAARISARRHGAGDDHPDVAIPLFPRTLFVAESVVGAKLDLIRTSPGMRSDPFLHIGEWVAMLRPFDVQVVQYIEYGEREIFVRQSGRKVGPVYRPKLGEQVRFLADEVLGKFKGTVSNVDDDGRITLWVELMKRVVRVKTTADHIGPV